MQTPSPLPSAWPAAGLSDLPPELMADIHTRLSFLDRLAFAAVSSAPSRSAFKPEPPWLVLPGNTPETSTIFSLADRRAATARASEPTMRDHVIIGSSQGWLVTADDRGTMRVVNPVTGDQGELPAITTIPFIRDIGGYFSILLKPFVDIRYGGVDDLASLSPPPYFRQCGTYTSSDHNMRRYFYRKVILSASPSRRAGGGGEGYAAMLLLQNPFGTPAFATAEDRRWRIAPSRDGVHRPIHHKGKFFSVTYTGIVEEWERGEGGEFRSKVVTTMMADDDDGQWQCCSKYIAAAPDGRLMIVIKKAKDVKYYYAWNQWSCSFKVQVFDEMTQRWEVLKHIGDLAILVGINGSMCVSTEQHPELKAGCVYYTNDDIGTDKGYRASPLRDGTLDKIPELANHHIWPLPAWFTPSFPLAPSRDGVEDAIHHHRGKFFSVTFTGVVEEWERDGVDGEFKSKVVTTRMDSGDGDEHRKYLAAAPDGRLMIVVENTKKSSSRWACSFTVQVFDEMTQRWEVAKDIGDLALLVGINSSMCVSTTKHPELKAGCVYYTDDEMGKASLRKGAGAARRISDHHDDDRRRNVGVYRLKDGAVGNMAGLGQHKSWPPPAWFTPCFP
uniref:KIB1-4 beta-propeller domain-containing protein n=1 Tax=Leersia perrieri TaxID=77586 RepID=A0A0D9W262_9ORYZ